MRENEDVSQGHRVCDRRKVWTTPQIIMSELRDGTDKNTQPTEFFVPTSSITNGPS